ncbi:MAG: serine hydrolase [Chitinivibrionales bacterium]|nr:serine hydrolase [Chitinivibrionales bacterium]
MITRQRGVVREKIATRIERAISDEVFPGCVVGVIDRSGTREIFPFGRFTYDMSAPDMSEDAVFDVASVTKSIPTSTLALMLIDRGELAADTRVVEYLPELQTNFNDDIRMQHLLTHTLDFRVRLSALKDLPPEKILQEIYTTHFEKPPGTAYCYSNASSILLGICLRRAADKPLDRLAGEMLFEPLQMHATTFHPQTVDIARIVPTEYDDWRGRLIRGEVHDESAWVLSRQSPAGSAGLFSTAPDLLNFLQMLLNNGRIDNHYCISSDMIRRMHTNQLSIDGMRTGLGWELCRRRYMGDACSDMTFGKTGFTGCVCLCDPAKGRALVFLSNFTYPRRKSSRNLINDIRKDIADMVFAT